MQKSEGRQTDAPSECGGRNACLVWRMLTAPSLTIYCAYAAIQPQFGFPLIKRPNIVYLRVQTRKGQPCGWSGLSEPNKSQARDKCDNIVFCSKFMKGPA